MVGVKSGEVREERLANGVFAFTQLPKKTAEIPS